MAVGQECVVKNLAGRVALIACATITVSSTSLVVLAEDPPDTETPAPAPTRPYVVSFQPGTSLEDQAAAVTAAGALTTDMIAVLNLHAVDASDEAIAALSANPLVAAADLDASRAVEAAPSDPDYAAQWSLPMIGWDQAYDTVAPAGAAVVAVLDTGVDAAHSDLDANIVPGATFVDGAAWSTDPNGHGTAMAGIVAAETNNAEGIAGVGYAGVTVMPVTVLGADGTGQDSDIIEGVVWATQTRRRRDPDVVLRDRLLLRAPGRHRLRLVQRRRPRRRRRQRRLDRPAFPAGDAGVIGVAATDRPTRSPRRPTSVRRVFLAAPGEGIATVDGLRHRHVSRRRPRRRRRCPPGRQRPGRDERHDRRAPGPQRRRRRHSRSDRQRPSEPVPRPDRRRRPTRSSQPAPPRGEAAPSSARICRREQRCARRARLGADQRPSQRSARSIARRPAAPFSTSAITLPVGYTNISVADDGVLVGHVEHAGRQPVDSHGRHAAHGRHGLATNNVCWARIDVTATTPAANQSGNAAEWVMQTFTNTAGTAGEQNDNPPVLIGDVTTNPTATITFVDAGGNADLHAGAPKRASAATVRVRVTQSGSGIKYTDIAVPTCFGTPSGVTATVSAGGNAYDTPVLSPTASFGCPAVRSRRMAS